MNVLLLPPSFDQNVEEILSRKCVEEKPARDALRVFRDALGYIELDSFGNVAKCHFQPGGKLRVIAVVAPVGEQLGVVLEMGINRTSPYRVAEYRIGSEKTVATIPRRDRAREIADSELESAYPKIEDILQRLLIRQRAEWAYRDEWWVGGLTRPVYRGIGIRVDRRDTLMYRQMLLEDIRLREKRIEKLSRSISFWLRGFRYPEGYKRGVLRSRANAGKVAEALSWQVDVPLHIVAAMRRQLGAHKNSKVWRLCEEIMSAYDIKKVDEDAIERMNDFLYAPTGVLPYFVHMNVRLETEPNGKTPKGFVRHGVGCLTLEVIPRESIAHALCDDDVPL